MFDSEQCIAMILLGYDSIRTSASIYQVNYPLDGSTVLIQCRVSLYLTGYGCFRALDR